MRVPKRAHLQINTNLDALAQVLSWFDQFNQDFIPQSTWLQCQLALAEGFTNAVRHAHKNYPQETPIEIELTLSNQSLEIRIWDLGSGFNLTERLDEISSEINREAEGGRGLRLMQQLSDSLSYARTDDQRNCLLIVKKLE